MKRSLFAGGLVLAALAVPGSATGDKSMPAKISGSVLAIETSRAGDYLVRVDARTLKPTSTRLRLGGHAYAWSFSPDGRRLALGVDKLRGIRIVDVRRLKAAGRVETWSGGIRTLAWVSPRRLIGWEPAGLFLIDPKGRKRLQSPENPGDIVHAERAGNRLVVLAGDPESSAARLAVVSGDGSVRMALLDRIRVTGLTNDSEIQRPALVLGAGGRAYVAGGTEGAPVAEIDLERLSVTYHDVKRSQSLAARFRNWLEPAAHAKEPLAGSWRSGAWLGDGKLAVWGYDSVRVTPDQVETRPAGLSVIDTSDWTARIIDAAAWHAAFAGGTLLATYRQGGLAGFNPNGDRRYHLFEGQPLGIVATFDGLAFVAFDRKPVHVLEAATGDVLGTRRGVPRLLHRSFSGW